MYFRSHLLNLVSHVDNTATPISNATQNIMYPIYDSDMIDNIGHRSRVLMSVMDESISDKRDEDKGEKTASKY